MIKNIKVFLYIFITIVIFSFNSIQVHADTVTSNNLDNLYVMSIDPIDGQVWTKGKDVKVTVRLSDSLRTLFQSTLDKRPSGFFGVGIYLMPVSQFDLAYDRDHRLLVEAKGYLVGTVLPEKIINVSWPPSNPGQSKNPNIGLNNSISALALASIPPGEYYVYASLSIVQPYNLKSNITIGQKILQVANDSSVVSNVSLVRLRELLSYGTQGHLSPLPLQNMPMTNGIVTVIIDNKSKNIKEARLNIGSNLQKIVIMPAPEPFIKITAPVVFNEPINGDEKYEIGWVTNFKRFDTNNTGDPKYIGISITPEYGYTSKIVSADFQDGMKGGQQVALQTAKLIPVFGFGVSVADYLGLVENDPYVVKVYASAVAFNPSDDSYGVVYKLGTGSLESGTMKVSLNNIPAGKYKITLSAECCGGRKFASATSTQFVLIRPETNPTRTTGFLPSSTRENIPTRENVSVQRQSETVITTPPTVLPWNAPNSIRVGETLNYTLNWTGGPVTGSPSGRWMTYVHFRKQGSTNIVFGGDFFPNPAAESWANSGITSTPASVLIPANIVPGIYEVYVGLYSGSTNVPMVAGSGVATATMFKNAYKVGTIEVKAKPVTFFSQVANIFEVLDYLWTK